MNVEIENIVFDFGGIRVSDYKTIKMHSKKQDLMIQKPNSRRTKEMVFFKSMNWEK